MPAFPPEEAYSFFYPRGETSITANTYSHVLPDMGDAAAGEMDEALS